jgi:D-beta-D-heptose 7-phosphate kinase / D-beta-D-heptose 1-phosphate adenosyltransferase
VSRPLLVVVGDTLLDRDVDGTVRRVAPDAPVPVLDEESTSDRPGGAGLAAVLATGQGYDVALVTALAADAGGERLTHLLAAAGVDTYALPLGGATTEKIRMRAGGQVLLRLDRGGGAEPSAGPLPEAVHDLLGRATAILVSDYGRGLTRHPELRTALEGAAAPIVWDPHPRGAAPVPGVRLVTPNLSEVLALSGDAGGGSPLTVADRAGHLLQRRWRAHAVCVTTGASGAVLCHAGSTPLAVPPPRVVRGDTCGAGDRFAVAAALALGDGVLVSEAVPRAVAAATDYIARGGVNARPAPDHDRRAAADVLAEVRAAGGTVVATGGCFDLLHAGHIATLQAARRLGDCLIVCLNSDSSVRGLKGPDRPLVGQDDRSRLLAALDCVDAVVVFEESTPEAVLTWLRPDVWVKGGDYTDPPEAELVRRWGGRCVIVPYLDGRSTTRMIAAARGRTEVPS